MHFNPTKLICLCLAGTLGMAGCHNPSSSTPTTMPAPEANMKSGGPATMPVPSAAAAPAAKDMTHVLTKDEPYFTNDPGVSSTPAGSLKEGTKVLMVVPGAQYSQVITDTGLHVYTITDGLKPIGK